MIAYVESNFVLELALQQEECEACSAIVELAGQKRLDLVVPAFSLAEPHVAIAGKEKARNQLRRDLDAHVRDLARSRPHHKVPGDFAAFAAVLADSAQFERDGVRKSVSDLVQCAEVIALDAGILNSALDLQTEFAISGQDSIVLASVLAHLETHRPTQSCFLNRNTKDFDDPDIRKKLDDLGCKFFGKFGQALGYIHSQID
jgi:hypothetical protein